MSKGERSAKQIKRAHDRGEPRRWTPSSFTLAQAERAKPAPVFNCHHGVHWADCTLCSKRTSKGSP